jgi:hypothetical protein
MTGNSEDSIMRKGYAFHEAGHAVAYHIFGFRIVNVSIKDQGHGRAGVTEGKGPHPMVLQQMGAIYEGTPEQAEYYSRWIKVSLAGQVAQKEHCPESLRPYHSKHDRASVNQYIKKVVTVPYPGEREKLIQDLYDETRELLTLPKYAAATHAVAKALQEHEELTGDQTTKIIHEAIAATRAK